MYLNILVTSSFQVPITCIRPDISFISLHTTLWSMSLLLQGKLRWRVKKQRRSADKWWKDMPAFLDPGPSDSMVGRHLLTNFTERSGAGPTLWRILLLRVCVSVCLLFLCVGRVSYFPCARGSWAVTIITSFSDSLQNTLQSFFCL